MNSNMIYNFHHQNIYALQELQNLNVTLLQYPKDVINSGKKALKEVITELSNKSEDFKNVYSSIDKHLKLSKEWSRISTSYYLNER